MQMKKPSSIKGLILSTIALSFLFLSGNVAHAALVTYSFKGSVSTISGALLSTPISQSPLSLGLPVEGSFQFDNSTGGVGGNFPNAVMGMNVAIGSYISSFKAGANTVTISQNTSLGGGLFGDRWKLVTTAGSSLAPVNGFTPLSFDLQLDREGGGLFSNTNLQNPPSFSSSVSSPLTSTRWRLIFEDMDGNVVNVRGALNSLSLTAVPLPAAVILFGAGLISLVGLGAGGLRNLRRPHQA